VRCTFLSHAHEPCAWLDGVPCIRARAKGDDLRKGLTGSFGLCLALAAAGLAGAARADDARQSRDDAWWTGPLLAASAATMPQGHWLFEPYLYDVITTGSIDAQGHHQALSASHEIGSQSYIIYAATDRLALAVLPRFAYIEPAVGPSSSTVGVGDVTLQAQYGLLSYQDGHYTPALSVVVAETLPTGRYDHLDRASDGIGSGVYSTSLALYSQDYFWLPNGRILRGRLDVTWQWSHSGGVEDASVYGTSDGFRGRVYPGDAATADLACEYSVTRSWVLALDLVYQHADSTRITGTQPPSGEGMALPFEEASGAGWSFGVAPAIEYSWSAKAGVIAGVRIIPTGRNTTTSVTPVAAINLVF